MPRLNPGDSFPKLTLSTTDGQLTTVPDAFARDFGVVLFYPGAWCPYCSPQPGQARAGPPRRTRRHHAGRRRPYRRLCQP
jgi:peroxiredoxin